MAEKIDGGPAFPSPALANEGFCPSCDMSGMTLRDWFAGQAMVGLMASGTWDMSTLDIAGLSDMIAARASDIADAMLAERAK